MSGCIHVVVVDVLEQFNKVCRSMSLAVSCSLGLSVSPSLHLDGMFSLSLVYFWFFAHILLQALFVLEVPMIQYLLHERFFCFTANQGRCYG